MAITITTGNFKGGVGKTTNAVMMAYEMSERGYNTLVVDLDPQANATDLLFTTMQQVYKQNPVFNKTLSKAMSEGDLSSSLINVKPNLDLLPSFTDLQNYENYLFENFDNEFDRDHNFDRLLGKSLEDKYDFILIDVPPQLNKFTNSALVTSDYVIVVLQTQERSLRGAEKYIEHLLNLVDMYSLGLELIGLLPVLFQNGSNLDMDVLEDSMQSFGKENIFDNKIKQMGRLKRFDRTGITDNPKDVHDKRVHEVYNNVLDETLQRIKLLEDNDE